MIKRLRFIFSYAARNMIRDRRRTAFTLLCVAAGVATVVALRALGWMLTDALTANAQAFMRGDLRVIDSSSGQMEISIFSENSKEYPFAESNIASINAWAAERGIEMTYALRSELMQAAVVTDGRAGTPALAMSVFIDPQVYPFYDIVRAEEPAGKLLADLFTGPNQIVLGRRLANQIDARVGDQVRIGASENLHTVAGIVPDAAESTFDNMSSLMFSFVYLDRAELEQFGLPAGVADLAYLKLPAGVDENVISREIRNWPRREGASSRYAHWSVSSATEALEQNKQIADVISRFVLVLSLVGLVIGGVGIINTMVVAVNRRSLEIAMLKTLGLQGRDISLVFMAEAALAGIVGSLFGIVLGILLSYIARDLGQRAFTFPLPWRVYFDPMVIGFALGFIITIFFSFLPTLMASRIRPNLVLREGNIPMARAGCLWTLLSFALLIVGFGLLIDLIIGTGSTWKPKLPPFLTPGIVGTLAVFITLGVIVALMWVLVWLLGKLPSFRNPNLRIAIRGLTTHRSRTALSLLALIIGMTALGGMLIMTRSINMLLYTSISDMMGGNMIIISLPGVRSTIEESLNGPEGVNGYRNVRFPQEIWLESIDGKRNFERLFDTENDPQAEMRLSRLDMLFGIEVHGNLPRGKLVEGRYLEPEDAGQPRITIPYLPELDKLGVKVGSTFTFSMSENGKRILKDFEVVGIVAPDAAGGMIPFSMNDTAMQIPLDMMKYDIPFEFIIVDVKKQSINEAMATVGAIPGLFVFDVTIFDSIISRLLNQLAALPLLVAGLSLFAATALIATTVALATMERRRQIAMLKAIGVSRWQTLGQLLAENGIIGITGGIISLLPTLLILLLIPSMTQGLVNMPIPVDLVLLMLLLSVLITIFATLVTAWGASGEKPLVALRYE